MAPRGSFGSGSRLAIPCRKEQLDPAVRDVHRMEGVNDVASYYAFRDGLRGFQPAASDLSKWAATPVKNPLPVINLKRTQELFNPRMSKMYGGDDSPLLWASRAQPEYTAAIQAASAANHRYALKRLHTVDQDAAVIRDDFRNKLIRRYKSVLGGWRVLDPRGGGRVSFSDLCRALPDLGYICDARALWNALDIKEDGCITLDEVDAGIAWGLAEFTTSLTKTCGSAAAAWRRHFSPGNELSRCSIDRFVWAAEAAGYRGDAARIFDLLNIDNVPTGVSFEDFSLLDKWFKSTAVGTWSPGSLWATNRTIQTLSEPKLQALGLLDVGSTDAHVSSACSSSW